MVRAGHPPSLSCSDTNVLATQANRCSRDCCMLSAPWTSRHHEKMSVDLLEDILGGEQSHTISRYLNDEEIRHIKDMITSEKGGQPAPPGKRWLYEVGPRTAESSRQCICAL